MVEVTVWATCGPAIAHRPPRPQAQTDVSTVSGYLLHISFFTYTATFSDRFHHGTRTRFKLFFKTNYHQTHYITHLAS